MSKPLLSLPWLTPSALFSRFIVVMVITVHTPIFVSGTELGRVSIHPDVKVAINTKCLAVWTVVTLVPHLKVAGFGFKNLIFSVTDAVPTVRSQQIQVKFGWKNTIQVTFESSVSVAWGSAWSKRFVQKMCTLWAPFFWVLCWLAHNTSTELNRESSCPRFFPRCHQLAWRPSWSPFHSSTANDSPFLLL